MSKTKKQLQKNEQFMQNKKLNMDSKNSVEETEELGIASYVLHLYKEQVNDLKDANRILEEKNKILKDSMTRTEKTKNVYLRFCIILFFIMLILSGYIIFTWDYFHPTIGIITSEEKG